MSCKLDLKPTLNIKSLQRYSKLWTNTQYKTVTCQYTFTYLALH